MNKQNNNKEKLNQEFKNIICNRIITLRKEKELTMEKLAYQSGISKGGLSEIERNLKYPMLFTLAQICAGLEITLNEFFNDEKINEFTKKL